MKRFLVSLCLFTSAAAKAQPPDEAALAFLKTLRETPDQWAANTALFPGTTAEKRLAINEQLKRLGSDLKNGDLRVVGSTTEGGLAGVIVSQIVEFDPNQVRVLAIGLVQREDQWMPAPVLASFENTGIRYQPTLATTAKHLEKWMLNERNRHLTRLREDTLSDLLTDIRASKPKAELLDESPARIVAGFMNACRDMNTPLALAHLGGLQENLPADWQATVSLTSRSLHAPWQATGQWQELTDPSALHTELATEVDETIATVTMGLFNPARSRPGPTEWTVRHFTLEKSEEGLWRICLPQWLLGEKTDEVLESLVDQNLETTLPTRLIRSKPRLAFDDPTTLVDRHLDALMSDDFPSTLPHLSRAISADESAALLSETARLWRTFQPKRQRPVRLDVHASQDRAWAIYGSFDPKRPEIPGSSLLHLILAKDELGWSVIASTAPSETESDLPAELIAWGSAAIIRDQDAWLPKLGLNQRLGGLANEPAPAEADSRTLAEAWMKALKAANPRGIFPLITGFDDDTAIERILAFLGQELSTPAHYELLGIHRHGRWAGASILHRTLGAAPVEHRLLHPIVVTPDGPRILPEGILYQATSRAQNYLNGSVWKRLRTRLPEASVQELETLYQEHVELCKSLTETE